MHHSLIPHWIVDVVYHAWKFVLGAFGRELPPPPYSFQVCKPFWLSLFALTLGLPLVLAAWAFRLMLGKKAVRRFWGKSGANMLLNSFFAFGGFAMLALMVLVLINTISSWVDLIVLIGLSIAFFAVVAGVVVSVTYIIDWLSARKEPKEEAFESVPAKIAKTAVLPVVLPLKAIRQVFRFIALMVHAAYNKYCPVVEKT